MPESAAYYVADLDESGNRRVVAVNKHDAVSYAKRHGYSADWVAEEQTPQNPNFMAYARIARAHGFPARVHADRVVVGVIEDDGLRRWCKRTDVRTFDDLRAIVELWEVA